MTYSATPFGTTHGAASSKTRNFPTGIPDFIYNHPTHYDYAECGTVFDEDDLAKVLSEVDVFGDSSLRKN